jgi:hypothetical protein
MSIHLKSLLCLRCDLKSMHYLGCYDPLLNFGFLLALRMIELARMVRERVGDGLMTVTSYPVWIENSSNASFFGGKNSIYCHIGELSADDCQGMMLFVCPAFRT